MRPPPHLLYFNKNWVLNCVCTQIHFSLFVSKKNKNAFDKKLAQLMCDIKILQLPLVSENIYLNLILQQKIQIVKSVQKN